jgi:hypothetical protein
VTSALTGFVVEQMELYHTSAFYFLYFPFPLTLYQIQTLRFSLALLCPCLVLLLFEQLVLISFQLTKFETIKYGITVGHLPCRFLLHKRLLLEFLGSYPWEWFFPFDD